MDGTIEARPELSDLLARVRAGETVTIVEHGRPVATVTPAPAPRPLRSEEEIQRLVAEMREIRQRQTLGGIPWKDLRDEGKR